VGYSSTRVSSLSVALKSLFMMGYIGRNLSKKGC
jgi:hypothetical protein